MASVVSGWWAKEEGEGRWSVGKCGKGVAGGTWEDLETVLNRDEIC